MLASTSPPFADTAVTISTIVTDPIILSDGPSDGAQMVLLQIFAWFAGLILSVALVTSMLMMVISMAGTGTAKRVGNKAEQIKQSRKQSGGGSDSGGGISGGGAEMDPLQAGGIVGSGGAAAEGGEEASAGMPVGGAPMPENAGEEPPDPTGGSVSTTDDGSLVIDPDNSDKKTFTDESGTGSYTPDEDELADGDDEVTLEDKKEHVVEQGKEKIGGLEEKLTGGRAGEMTTALSEAGKFTGAKAYENIPAPAKKFGNLAKRGGSAAKDVFDEPTVGDSIGRMYEIARESPIGAQEPDPTERGPISEWGTDAEPDVHPLGKERHEELFGDDSNWETERMGHADYLFQEDGTAMKFENLSADEQADHLIRSFSSTESVDQFTEYEQAQISGNMQRFYDQVKDPEVATDAFEDLRFELTDGRAEIGTATEATYSVYAAESFEEFSHEMHHRVMDNHGYDYAYSGINPAKEYGDNQLTPNDLSQDFGIHTHYDEYPDLNFDEGVTRDGAELPEPRDAMFRQGNHVVGAQEWGDDVIEDLQENYDVDVDESMLPDKEVEEPGIHADPETETEENIHELASAANKALFKQQMVTNKAMNAKGFSGLPEKRKMKEVSIGESGYSATNAHETIAQTGEVLQTTDAERAQKQIPELQEHHPELVEKYQEVFEVSDTANNVMQQNTPGSN